MSAVGDVLLHYKSKLVYNSDPDEFLNTLNKLPIEVRHIYAASWCDAEIRNGGFKQYFNNTTGNIAPEAVEAFLAMNLNEVAGIVKEALSLFDEYYPREAWLRQEEMQQRKAKVFDKLDEQYYRFENTDDMIEAYAMQAVKQNPSQLTSRDEAAR